MGVGVRPFMISGSAQEFGNYACLGASAFTFSPYMNVDTDRSNDFDLWCEVSGVAWAELHAKTMNLTIKKRPVEVVNHRRRIHCPWCNQMNWSDQLCCDFCGGYFDEEALPYYVWSNG